MQFGITLKPDISVERIVGLTRQAEAAGFQYGWIFDSHVLWKEPYPLLTLMAANTQRMRLRHAGDQSRGSRSHGDLQPVRHAESDFRWQDGTGHRTRRQLETRARQEAGELVAVGSRGKVFRDLTAGREIEYEGQPTRLTWATVSPRVWIAGYGPKVLHMAGRVADGIILQFADPDLISWCLGFVKEGARAAGRDPDEIEVMSAAPVWVSDDLAVARERVRWFPALVSNHVMDLIRQYKPEDLPAALTSYVQDRGGYDYLHHCVVESDNANFVSDEVVDRFCVVGPVKAHHEKLRKLASVGVTQFNLYLMCGDEEQSLDIYQREVLPAFQETAKTKS